MRALPLLGLGLMLLVTGCRTNLLPEYHCKFNNAHAAVETPPPGRVALSTKDTSRSGRSDKQQRTSLLQVGANISSWDAGTKAQDKLRTAMPSVEVQRVVQQVVEKEGPNLGFPFVESDAKPTRASTFASATTASSPTRRTRRRTPRSTCTRP